MSMLLENLPDNWDIIALGDINIRKAPTLTPKNFADETFEYYSIPDYQRDQTPSLTAGDAIESSKLLLEPKTVLFGKLNPRVEKVWRVAESSEFRQIGSTEWIPIFPGERVDSDFLYFLEWSDHVLPIAKTLVSGSTPSRQRVDPKSFYRITVPLPPLPEQKKVVHILSTVQRAIEAQKRIIQTTTELKKALMHKLFTEGTRSEPQKQTEIGPIPESWEVKPLVETVEYIDYGVSKAIPKTDPPGGVKIVSTADIDKQGNLSYWKIRRVEVPEKTEIRLRLRNGDVLFNWRNSAELIGKTTVFEEQEEPHIFASFILRIATGEKNSHNYFLKHLMNHYRQEGVFVKLARRAVNQANYNKNEISALKIPTPPYDEQVEIANTIRGVEVKTRKHEEKRATLQSLFRTLLHGLMTAAIRADKLELDEKGTTV